MSRRLIRSCAWAFSLLLLLVPGVSRADIDLSKVIGEWAGDWSGKGEKGWLSMSVDAQGAFTGLVVSRTSGEYGSHSGQIAASGAVSMAGQVSGSDFTATGNAKPGKNSMTLALSVRDPETGEVSNIKATVKRRNPNASMAKYVGEWGGTLSVLGVKATMRLVVGADGHVTGEVGGSDAVVDSSDFGGTMLPNGIFLGEGESVSAAGFTATVAEAKVSGSSMSFSIYIADDETGKSVTIKVSLKKQAGVSPWIGNWTGAARTRQGVIVDVEFNIDQTGRISGTWRNTDDGTHGELMLLVVHAGTFAGITTENDEFSEYLFGTLKRGKTGGLTGTGTVLDLEGDKTNFTLTLAPG